MRYFDPSIWTTLEQGKQLQVSSLIFPIAKAGRSYWKPKKEAFEPASAVSSTLGP